jgi:hypothetical protein
MASTGVRENSSGPTSKSSTLQVQASNFSQGKFSDSDAVTKYADAIGGNWRRGVEAFLEIGRLTAGIAQPEQHHRQSCLAPNE